MRNIRDDYLSFMKFLKLLFFPCKWRSSLSSLHVTVVSSKTELFLRELERRDTQKYIERDEGRERERERMRGICKHM